MPPMVVMRVAHLQVGEHVLNFLILLALGTDEQEIEHDHDQNKGRDLHQYCGYIFRHGQKHLQTYWT